MASRFGQRTVSQAFRAASRSTFQRVNAGAKRRMASTSHAPKPDSDTPWIIGSALVFGPAILYLLFPSGKDKAHEHGATQDKHFDSKAVANPVPAKEELPAEEPAAEAEAESTEAPQEEQKSDDAPSEEPSDGAEMTDDDGEAVSGKDVKESMEQGFNTDSPKDAQAAEEGKAEEGEEDKHAEGAPEQTSEAEADHEQKSKPQEETKEGTFQSSKDDGPTELSAPREAARKKTTPKEAAKE
ncbi:hypothetical protein JAAARDRAFT_66314 [Jaapia argillacea MUCL 33604]|uniref:Uncharacterized protein n=1 Tax=Jaapia argillacea MUCL 33604 TaxID=933084 RepID=A0A067QGH9_9AGAM|nr:hypothetical protein JAAARDRAFT_66314 [Jaapia argillacea MUCL 33604]